jgi:phospholipase/lecithinase/hemolysin
MLGLDGGMRFGAPPSWLPGAAVEPEASPHASYSTLYAFGDSLSDVGNDYSLSLGVLPTPLIYSDGRFSNGPLWVQDLAKDLGLGAVKASLDGGRDFAYGGAETGSETLHSITPIDLPSQLGANDLQDAIPEYATNQTAALTDIQQAVNNEVAFVKDLAALGARNFVILNVPDLGKTPADRAVASTASNLSALYDQELNTSLAALATSDNLAIHLVNTYALIDEAVADPAAFGLKNVTTPVWTGNYENPFSGHLNATGKAQNAYLFFDHLHPTATGHLALANAAYASLAHIV